VERSLDTGNFYRLKDQGHVRTVVVHNEDVTASRF
jgi:hypothetical protein